MKPKKFNKKLVFNKETIADLNQNNVRGGKPTIAGFSCDGGFTCAEYNTCNATCDPRSILVCEETVNELTCDFSCNYTQCC